MARWAVVTGHKGDKKAEFVLGVAKALEAAGLRVAGFVQRRWHDGDQKGHDLERVATGERLRLSQDGVAAKSISQDAFCTYAFENDGFARAFEWLREDGRAADVLVLDDVSKLETQGKGHAAALTWALAQADKLVVISARASQLFYVVENFGLQDDPIAAAELPVGEDGLSEFAREIARALR
ncbi:MAG: DUF2478 domain-containing protein [Myxococcales bacterium]